MQHFNQGAELFLEQQYSKAEQEWVTASQLFEALDQPTDQADTYYWLSRALAERTLYEVAVEYVDKAKEVEPRDGLSNWRMKLLRLAGMQAIANSRAFIEEAEYGQAINSADKAHRLLEEGGAQEWQLTKAESLVTEAETKQEEQLVAARKNPPPLVRKPRPAEKPVARVRYTDPKPKYPTYRPRYDEDDDDDDDDDSRSSRRKKKRRKTRTASSTGRTSYYPKPSSSSSSSSRRSSTRSRNRSSKYRSKSRRSSSSDYRSSNRYEPSSSYRRKNLYRPKRY